MLFTQITGLVNATFCLLHLTHALRRRNMGALLQYPHKRENLSRILRISLSQWKDKRARRRVWRLRYSTVLVMIVRRLCPPAFIKAAEI